MMTCSWDVGAACAPGIPDDCSPVESKPFAFLPDVTCVYSQPVYDESLCCFATWVIFPTENCSQLF